MPKKLPKRQLKKPQPKKMTGTNHIITGAVIAAIVRQPLLTVPLAFGSHFVLDSLPHFGFPDWDKARLKHRRLINSVIAADALFIILLICLFIAQGAPALFYMAGLAAFAPDLVWVYQFIVYHHLEASESRPHNGFNRFHENLQIRERPSGIYIEIVFLIVMAVVLARLWP